MPNIYSSLYIYDGKDIDNPKYYIYADYADPSNNLTIDSNKISINSSTNNTGICEYKFKWIKNLGFHMIIEIVIK